MTKHGSPEHFKQVTSAHVVLAGGAAAAAPASPRLQPTIGRTLPKSGSRISYLRDGWNRDAALRTPASQARQLYVHEAPRARRSTPGLLARLSPHLARNASACRLGGTHLLLTELVGFSGR